MAELEYHPNVFRFEGRLWVSELPKDEMLRQLTEQRSWDAATARQERWWIAIAVGAGLGVAATLGIGIATGVAPTAYLLALPLGFGVGAVLGAVVNRRIVGSTAPSTPRPAIATVRRVPNSVARHAPADASASDLLAWSERGFVS
jgi:hypothetical protein